MCTRGPLFGPLSLILLALYSLFQSQMPTLHRIFGPCPLMEMSTIQMCLAKNTSFLKISTTWKMQWNLFWMSSCLAYYLPGFSDLWLTATLEFDNNDQSVWPWPWLWPITMAMNDQWQMTVTMTSETLQRLLNCDVRAVSHSCNVPNKVSTNFAEWWKSNKGRW